MRPHDGGTAHTGAGVRKPPTEVPRERFSPMTRNGRREGVNVRWSSNRQARPGSCLSDGSTVFFREHVRIEVGDPLLAFLRDLQISERIADIGPDGLPEESGVGCP